MVPSPGRPAMNSSASLWPVEYMMRLGNVVLAAEPGDQVPAQIDMGAHAQQRRCKSATPRPVTNWPHLFENSAWARASASGPSMEPG